MTDTIPTGEAVPAVPAELRQRIAFLTAEAEGLLPGVAAFAERARTTRQEYRSTLNSLGVDDIGEVAPEPGWSWPADDWATYRDGLDALGDAINDLQVQLASVFENYII